PVPAALKWNVPCPATSNSNVPLPSAHVCTILIPVVPPTSWTVPDGQSGEAAVNVNRAAVRWPESVQVISLGPLGTPAEGCAAIATTTRAARHAIVLMRTTIGLPARTAKRRDGVL